MAVATIVLSGCAPWHLEADARDEAIRGGATAMSETMTCLADLQITAGEDLDALARQNGLCGNWLALGLSDEELSLFRWNASNTTWLIRIDESTTTPVISMLTVGDGRANALTQWESHTVIVCWQATLHPSPKTLEASGLDCPSSWLTSWGAAEVMTLEQFTDVAKEYSITIDTP